MNKKYNFNYGEMPMMEELGKVDLNGRSLILRKWISANGAIQYELIYNDSIILIPKEKMSEILTILGMK